MSQPLICGEIHYFRVPKPLWRDRLLKLKRAGANCVSTYIPWNWHALQKDRVVLDGDHSDWYTPGYYSRSLKSYLETAIELGLKIVARPGPYICSEWDGGGHPSWLYSECQKLRSLDRCYMDRALEWYRAVLPLISGFAEKGHIPVVQVENEYFWGNEQFLERLAEEAFKYVRENSLIVTNENWYLSRIPNTIDDYPTPWNLAPFEEKVKKYATSQPGLFKMFMELQGGWFSSIRHGRAPTDRLSIPAEWTELLLKTAFIHGVDNFNIYMFHGGTNPGYYTGKYITTSYDYEAPVREWGELSQRYYNIKRFYTLLATMWKVLVGTKPAPPSVAYSSTCARVLARSGEKSTVLLLLNEGDYPCYVKLFKGEHSIPSTGSIRIPPRYGKLVFVDTHLPDSGFTLSYSTLEPLLHYNMGGLETLVLYGELGEEFETVVHSKSVIQRVLSRGGVRTAVRGTSVFIRGAVDQGDSIVVVETVDNRRLLVIATNRKRAERTWFLTESGLPVIVVSNTYYVGEVRVEGGALNLEVELDENSCGSVLLVTHASLESVRVNNVPVPVEKLFDGVYLANIPASACKPGPQLWIALEETEVEEDHVLHAPESIEPLKPLEEKGYYDGGLYVYKIEFSLTTEDLASLGNGVVAISGVFDYAVATLNDTYLGSGYHFLEADALPVLREGVNELVLLVESTGHPNDGVLYVPSGVVGGIYLGLDKVVQLSKWKRIPHKPSYGASFDMSEFVANPKEVESLLANWRFLEGVEDAVELARPGLYVAELHVEDLNKHYVLDPGQGFYTNYYYRALLFVNRRYLGPIKGPVDITSYLRPGWNELAIYVEYAYLAPVLRIYRHLVKGRWMVQKGTQGLLEEWYRVSRQFKYVTTTPLKFTGLGGRVYWVKATFVLDEEPSCLKPLKLAVKAKGLRIIAYVNGNFVGRIYDDSPTRELYIPEPALRRGINSVVLLCLVASNDAVLESIEVSDYYTHSRAIVQLRLEQKK